jgi:hypothetical protein
VWASDDRTASACLRIQAWEEVNANVGVVVLEFTLVVWLFAA